MRIAVVGAGGVGALVGGLLARAGNEVAFVARGAQLAALREKGLRVESARGSFHLPRVEASDDPASLRPAEAVLVAVKGWQVAEVAPRLAPLLAPGAFAVPLENGVEAADRLAAALGEERVVGGLCHMIAWLEAPGLVRQQGEMLRVTLGKRPDGAGARLEPLAAALRAAGIDAVLADDVEAAVWEKFLFISAFGGVGAATRAPAGVVRSRPETRALLSSAMEEVAALARARGVRLASGAVARALAIVDGLAPGATASMQRDVQAGRPSELVDQTGAIVRLAREAGVPAPVNGFLLAALLPQEVAARTAAGLPPP
ncbi:MAG TPA: 2-dehydropantoate 2-reductase [Anaeromyxobacteraceae bacterium]|nr:2-dehydropantoate 2-reductase [Anaeromyxobacteraceae bacterium]